MKYAVVILALVVLFSATASAFTWGTWEVVDTVSGDLDQVAMAVRQGKVALVYQKTYVYGSPAQVLYSEYVYSSKYGKTLAIQDERVPNTMATPLGTNICGIALDPWNQPYVAVVPKAENTFARVLKRQNSETYIYEDASNFATSADSSLGVTSESFTIDSNNDLHFVWASDASGIKSVVYAKRAAWKMAPSESSDWVRSTKATTGILSAVKPAIATGAAGAKYISYLDNNSGSSIFYTLDMSAGRVAGYCGVTDPLGSYHDIEFLSTAGKAMIAHMETTSGNVGNIVTELDKTSTSWFKRPVVSNIDLRNYGWYGTNPYLDLQYDGTNMAMVVACLDNYDLGSAAKTIIKYSTYVLGSWSDPVTIGTFDTGTNFISGISLKFDENGKPFVAVVARQTPTGDPNVLLLTTTFSGPDFCGDYTTSYLPGDLDKDCDVDLSDLCSLTTQWLECTNPAAGSGCDGVGILPREVRGFPPVLKQDGQYIFPIGWYCHDAVVPDGTQAEMNAAAVMFLNKVKASGSNFVMPYFVYANEPMRMTAFLEAGNTTGVKTLQYCQNTITSEIVSQVNYCENYSSLLGWYTADEPEAFNTPPATLQNLYNIIKANDSGTHPVVVMHHGHWYGATPYMWPTRHADIIATDRYPVYSPEFSGELWVVAQNAEYWTKVVGGIEQSAYFAGPQAFGGEGGWVLPTYNETRYLSYAPIVYGARGLFFFMWGGTTTWGMAELPGWPEYLANAATPIIGEINQLVPAIISNSTAVTATSNRDTDTTGHYIRDVGYLFGQDQNYGYLMAVNNTPGTLTSVQFSLSGVGLEEVVGSGNSATIPVMYESRNVTLAADGADKWKIVDTFTPYAVHVYRLYAVPAAQQCGDLATVYSEDDLNGDCRVNFEDFSLLAGKWLE